MSSPSVEHLPTYNEARAAGAAPSRTTAISSELPTEHAFHLLKASGHRWLTLCLRSNSGSSTSEPYFFGGDCIKGTVELHLRDPERIRSIELSIMGRMTWDTARRTPFLKVSQTVWSAPDDSLFVPQTLLRYVIRPSLSLSGNHTLPFSITLPSQTNLLSEPFALPASFEETGASHAVSYSFSLEVTRGNLSPSSWILEPFTYVPALRPPPLPAALTGSSSGNNLLTSEGDPSRWDELSPVILTGKLFSTRQTSVRLTLSMAAPLTYTRGTIIPLFIMISSDDSQALDLLASSRALNIRLVLVSKSERAADMRMVQRALWFPDALTTLRGPEKESGTTIRRLRGEIYLSTGLKPGIKLPTWSLSYAVALFPFDAPGFVSTPSVHAETPLLAKQVEIASMYPRGGSRFSSHVPQGEVRFDPPEDWRRGAGKEVALFLKL